MVLSRRISTEAMLIPKRPKPVRSLAHRKHVARYHCVICNGGRLIKANGIVSQCCHIRIGFYCTSDRPCDSKTTPMCLAHHMDGPDSQHDQNEEYFWEKHGIDPFQIANMLATQSPSKKIRETMP